MSFLGADNFWILDTADDSIVSPRLRLRCYSEMYVTAFELRLRKTTESLETFEKGGTEKYHSSNRDFWSTDYECVVKKK
jgi:hypothetical protein